MHLKKVCRAGSVVLQAAVFCSLLDTASGQAWAPHKGEGSVNFAFQRISNLGHRLTDGKEVAGTSTNMGLFVATDYAPTDRLSLSVGIPYVFGKWTDPDPPPFGLLPVDACRCWNSGFQDWSLTSRFNIANDNFALTPSVSVVLPSQNYDFRGEAALGRHLNEVRLAIDAGQRLGRISPKLFVQGSYSYAFVERPLDISVNRSNIFLEAGFFITERILLHATSQWQRTHGGLRAGSLPPTELLFPGEVNTPERAYEHDRLLRDNYWHPGVTATYSFEKMDVFMNYVYYASGSDTHRGRAFSFGVSFPFQISGQ
jgi:hypothetical protein